MVDIPNSKSQGLQFKFVGIFSLAMILFHLYSAFFDQPEPLIFRSTFVCFILVLCFLLKPLGGEFWKGKFDLLFIINFFFVLLPILIQYYILYDIQGWYLRFGNPTYFDLVLGMIYVFLILEATRRSMGLPIVIIATFFFFHARFANYIKIGIFYGPPMSWSTIIELVWMQPGIGIYSAPVEVVASVIVLFLVFSSLLLKSGMVKYLLNFAYVLAGKQVGGPAKVAVVSSALMGTISGSTVANVATTGSITIPLMKRLGYKDYFAGAVEATASTGGQLMPPVMGAAAFLMAVFLGVSYIQVCIYAAIPATLYFLSVFLNVHYESVQKRLPSIPTYMLPRLSQTLKQGGHMFLAIVVLLYFLIRGYSIQMAIMWTIIITFFLTFVRKDTRFTPQLFSVALQDAAKMAISVGTACACAGIIIGSISISGLGWKMSNLLMNISGEQHWISLLLAMIISIILGMGMTTTAVYLIVVTMVIPSLIKIGITAPVAHLFCLYFGVLSNITPPVAVASFAAASIAESKVNPTAFEACRISLVGYAIPFLFVQYPELLLIREGSWLEVLIVFIIVFISVICFAAGVRGWFMRRLNLYERILMMGQLVFVLVRDIRNPVFAAIFLIIFSLIIFLQKFFSYKPNKLESYFLKFSELLYRKKRDNQITNIQKSSINGEQTKNADLLQSTNSFDNNISEKGKNKWQGWLVWGVSFTILAIMGKNHYSFEHFNSFLIILLFMSFLIIKILELLNKTKHIR